jgi:hypothetical protein
VKYALKYVLITAFVILLLIPIIRDRANLESMSQDAVLVCDEVKEDWATPSPRVLSLCADVQNRQDRIGAGR